MTNENNEGKKTLFIEPFYVFALLEDHLTSLSGPTQNQFGDKMVFKIRLFELWGARVINRL